MCRHLLRGPVDGHFAGAAGAAKHAPRGEKSLFRDFRKKNGIAVIFREVTAMANRSGVQAKRAFFDHRRDFWRLNILNRQNRTDSGDTPESAFFAIRWLRWPAFLPQCEKMPSFSRKSASFWPHGQMGEKPGVPTTMAWRGCCGSGRHVNSCPSRTPRR